MKKTIFRHSYQGMNSGRLSRAELRKAALFIMILGVITILLLAPVGTHQALAQGPITPVSTTTNFSGPYFTSRTHTYADGTSLNEYIINGPSQPPAGYAADHQAVPLPVANLAAGTVTLTVPAFKWSFGCSATSGAMIAAYYDRNGFANMYTGPTNGGVMPLDSSPWPFWTDGIGHSYAQCPLTASHLGLDGRLTRGSIDDYWTGIDTTASDPYITGGWTQHTFGDAIGDYMHTSQSAFGNVDGSTTFWGYSTYPGPYTCSALIAAGHTNDGTVGRKAFYEAKGYTVTDCYNQNTDNNNAGGFTFAMYKAQIDAGRPVMLNLAGHTVVGVGYDDTNNTINIHDTWDYQTYSMAWGGSYYGMELLSVSIVNFTTGVIPGSFAKSTPANAAAAVSTSPTLSWGISSGASSYEYCYDTTNDNSCATWVSNGLATNKVLSGLNQNTTYYWHVRAVNGTGTTYADGGSAAFWSFTTGGIPLAFTKSTPANAATSVSLNPTLSWGASSGATSYEYCYDTSNDNTCTTWIGNGPATSITLSGLNKNTTYYWHVRAVSSYGATYSGGSAAAFWSFTTGDVPGAFNRSTPANAASNVSPLTSLTWGASSGATSYETCYDMSNDNTCTNWTSSGAATSQALNGLIYSTPYYWHVRAVNSFGMTYADGNSSTAFWSFTVQPGSCATPSTPVLLALADGVTTNDYTPTLTWNASAGATLYDFMLDNDADFTSPLANITNTASLSYTPYPIFTNGIFNWKVRGHNTSPGCNVYGNWSTPWTFNLVNHAKALFMPILLR